MTILEDLKSGRLVVVPPLSVKPLEWSGPDKEGTVSAMAGPAIADVWPDCGRWYWRLGDVASGGGEISEDAAKRMLWATYEARILSALADSCDHTAGLIALVEGIERGLDAEKRAALTFAGIIAGIDTQEELDEWMKQHPAVATAEARALAAEAERDALREAMAFYADEDNYKDRLVTLTCGCCSDHEPAAIGPDGDEGQVARAALARALTEKNNG